MSFYKIYKYVYTILWLMLVLIKLKKDTGKSKRLLEVAGCVIRRYSKLLLVCFSLAVDGHLVTVTESSFSCVIHCIASNKCYCCTYCYCCCMFLGNFYGIVTCSNVIFNSRLTALFTSLWFSVEIQGYSYIYSYIHTYIICIL